MAADQWFIDAIAAAEIEDWGRTLTCLRQHRHTMRQNELRGHPELAFGAARAALLGGFAIGQELWRIFGGKERFDAAIWPTKFARSFFASAAAAICDGVRRESWEVVYRQLAEMIALPSATRSSREVIRRLLTLTTNTVHAKQASAMTALLVERRRQRIPSGVWETPTFLEHHFGPSHPFALPIRLLEALTQSDSYSDLVPELLKHALSKAEWPMLIFFDQGPVLALWPEILDLLDRPTALNALSPAGGEWLQRTTRSEPEGTAPGEFESDSDVASDE